MVYSNRAEAGRRLAEHLWVWRAQQPVVIALAPRGTPLAVKIAETLGFPLDAVFVHEIAVPGRPAGVLGAVGEGGVRVVNQEVCDRLGIGSGRLEREAHSAGDLAEGARRALRAITPEVPVAGRTVILVNDGVATGAAASVGIRILRDRGVERIVFAVPVGARGALRRLRPKVDALVCARVMPWPRPVDEWYEDYPEVTDDEAGRLLAGAGRWMTAA
ncbi:MAG TPA: phosphoribosyltransferase family protein [Thermoleophilia bacterium]|nr:phosphoribosyltransferase family protein [Thermoleophilia bacterium]